MQLMHRMTSWAPDTSPGVNATLAYPVYSILDPDRPLLYVSNDARCTVEVIDVSTLLPKKLSNYTSCPLIEYNSQIAYDRGSRRLFTAAQHANSFAVLDMTSSSQPKLLGWVQDANRTSRTHLLAGATGCAVDPLNTSLAFVVAEYSKSFARRARFPIEIYTRGCHRVSRLCSA
jgi:hypothetical protein